MKPMYILLLSLFSFNSFAQQYCEYLGDCSGDWIVEVTFNGYKNNTNGCVGYGDYSDSVDFYVQPGATFNVDIDWATYLNSAGYFWIDWDKSGTWDASEMMTVPYTGSTNGTSVVVVPDGVTVGDVLKMRVMLANQADPPDPCVGPVGLYNVDEVEDYEIQVVGDLPTSGGGSYCNAQGSDCGWGHIAKVEFAGKQNASTCTFYGDYTDTIAFKVDAGSDYTLTVTWAGQGTAYNYTMAAWIDYNRNYIFETEEMTAITASGLGVSSGTISIPTNVNNMLTRMRIRMTQNDAPAPCGQQSRGEVEDYAIIIGTPPPTCAIAENPDMGFQGICQKDAELRWSANPNGESPTGYKLWFGSDQNATNLISGIDVGNVTKYNLNFELQKATNYYWKVVPYNAQGDATGCTVWQFTTTTNGDPIPDIIVDRNSASSVTLCQDEQLTLFANVFQGLGNKTYEWTGDDITYLSNTNKDSAHFNSNTIGTNQYIVRVEDELGCYGTDTISVEVTQKAMLGNLVGDVVYCDYDTLELAISDAFGDLQWQLNTGSGWLDITGATKMAYTDNNPVNNTSYRIYASTGVCADTSASATITVYDPMETPEIKAVDDAFDFCPGDSVIIYSSISGDNKWSSGSSADTLVFKNPATLSLYRENSLGCISGTVSASVGHHPVPNKPVIKEARNGEVSLCEGKFTQMSIDKQQGTSISWNGDPQLKASKITVQDPGKYYVDVVNEFGCTNVSDTVILLNRPSPDRVFITLEGDTNFMCQGDSLFLSLETEDEVTWNVAGQASEKRIKITETGSYFATITNSFGCTAASDTMDVFTFENPAKPIIKVVGDKYEFCEGDSTRLRAISEDSYYWNGDTNFSQQFLYVSQSASLWLKAVNDNGCMAFSDTVSVVQHPLPEKPVITSVEGDLHCSVTDAMIQWYYIDGFPVDSANQPVLEDAMTGYYYVEVTDSLTGCSNRSEVFTSIINVSPTIRVGVYPNPAKMGDVVKVEANQTIHYIELRDTQGRVILAKEGNSFTVNKVAKGSYLISVYDQNHALLGYSNIVFW
ncbi:GEVED domain-containing protein [Luteibaculum oceani]|uniref:T9SS type A sorting domain-containing protein n=1 Tax=Luteibaculum oceani TaxID=1294296 RepID=A0A5C6VNN6_9FLAO|nr:GEVED domain-containing protein [Luteibaculum oceani]TXC85215.1 T9SS type A sorting domain-containing protein [Luteibaculum oceani]